MKIVFENIDEKDAFLGKYCPHNFNLPEFEDDLCNPRNCTKCWEAAGVKLDLAEKDNSLERIADGLENIYGFMLKSEQCRLKNEINSLKFEQEKQRLFQAFENGGKTDD